MQEGQFERCVLTCDGQDYLTVFQELNDETTISLERLADQERWFNVFTTQYLEDLTARTKAPRSASIIRSMLRQGLRNNGQTGSLSLHLLPRNKVDKMQGPAQGQEDQGSMNDRMYLVVMIKSEFETVFYPLPVLLMPQEQDIKAPEYYFQRELRIARAETAALREQLEQVQASSQPLVSQAPAESAGAVSELREKARQLGERADQLEQQLKEAQQKVSWQEQRLQESQQQIQAMAADKEEMMEAMNLAMGSKTKYKQRYIVCKQTVQELQTQLAQREQELQTIRLSQRKTSRNTSPRPFQASPYSESYRSASLSKQPGAAGGKAGYSGQTMPKKTATPVKMHSRSVSETSVSDASFDRALSHRGSGSARLQEQRDAQRALSQKHHVQAETQRRGSKKARESPSTSRNSSVSKRREEKEEREHAMQKMEMNIQTLLTIVDKVMK